MFPIFKPFALLLTAHLLGDVFFTSYRLSLLKRSSTGVTQVLGIALHCCVHALFAGILLILADRLWLRGAVLVFVFHFLIDLIRSSVEKRKFGPNRIHVKRSEFMAWISGKSDNPAKMNMRNLRPWFLINILDQGAHVVSLLAIACTL
jgi:hypothetical protein